MLVMQGATHERTYTNQHDVVDKCIDLIQPLVDTLTGDLVERHAIRVRPRALIETVA